MSNITSGNIPGFQEKLVSDESQVTWSGRHDQNLIATRSVTIDAASVDSGNTPETTLRAGTIMSIHQTTGKAHPYQADANDGTQIPLGVLEQSVDMVVDGESQDRFAQVLVQGMLKESEIHNLDPHAKEVLSGRFLFDQAPFFSSSMLLQPRAVQRKSSDYTIDAAETGTLFVADNAVAFTLPSQSAGLSFRLFQSTDNALSVITLDGIIYKGNFGGNLISCDTANERIGSHLLVECVYIGSGALTWIVSNLGDTTITI